MMIGERAINVGEQGVMLTGQQRDHLLDDFARGTVARVPADAERPGVVIAQQPRDIIVDYGVIADRPLADLPVRTFAQPVEVTDVGTKKWRMGKYHLEAIILAGVVTAGYLNAAIDLEHRLGIIEHGRRAQAYAHDIYSRFTKPADQLPLKAD